MLKKELDNPYSARTSFYNRKPRTLLLRALETYRAEFRPSETLKKPYAMPWRQRVRRGDGHTRITDR